jgi:hypothetical protein
MRTVNSGGLSPALLREVLFMIDGKPHRWLIRVNAGRLAYVRLIRDGLIAPSPAA